MILRADHGSPFIAAAIALACMASASAQPAPAIDAPIIERGDAVVTGFSGVTALKPKPNAKLEDYLIIDTQSAALQVFDLTQMLGPADARLVDAPRLHSVPAGQIGQVFGVTLDDGRPATGPDDGRDPVPNFYATATSAYGLQIVETRQIGNQRVRERARKGSAQASWMAGQFGIGGGPGSIWKIDGRTGEASLFANVTLDGVANSGPALGAIAFDPKSRRLFVSDLQTGMIHAFDLTGREVGRFDHGTQGRPRQGLAPVAFDPNGRVEITSPAFNVEDPVTWGFTARGRRVWGLAVHDGRLFYAPVDGPDIWSVGLTENGDFASDAHLEIEVKTRSGDPVTAIAFGSDGAIYLTQRGQQVPSYDYRVMARPDTAETLRYKRRTLSNGRVTWQPAPEEYAIGHAPAHRSSNGGIALGYGYDSNGFIRYDACDATLWTTGDVLRQSAQPNPRLTAGGETIVHGLQGNAIGAVKPDNDPPMRAFYLDYDGQFEDPSYRGHLGQVAIWGCDHGRQQIATPVPRGPRIRVAKSCSSAGLGERMHCRVTLFNAGDEAPRSPVGFSDAAEIVRGPRGAGRIRIVSATPDGRDWGCSRVPSSTLSCEIGGVELQPGRRRSVDVVMDVSSVAGVQGFRVRNCATLNDNSRTDCASAGGDLTVSKVGDTVCEAGGLCTFLLNVINNGRRAFNGRVFLADTIAIPGVAALDVAFVSPHIPGCNTRTLPFLCNVPLTLGAGSWRTFEVTIAIPLNAVPPNASVQGRNCFFASDPNLIPDGGRRPISFLRSTLQTLNPGSPAAGSGFACWNFKVQAPGMGPIPPRCEIPIARLKVTPAPARFSAANENIKVELELTHTGNSPFDAIDNWKITAPQLKNLRCPAQGRSIAPRTSMKCQADYTTTAADVGNQVMLSAVATGDSTCGSVAPANASGIIDFSGTSTLTLAATASPATFAAANEKIVYTYTIKNTGTVPFPFLSLLDDKATDLSCPGAAVNVQSCTLSGRACGSLGAGASLTCTGSYVTKVGDVGSDIVATSVAGGAISGPDPSNPGFSPHIDVMSKSANTVVKFVPPANQPGMSLALTPAPATFSAANEKITYTFTVKNAGNTPVTGFVLNDSKATGLKCPPANAGATGGPLAPGTSVTCTGEYTTTAADVGKDIASTANLAGTSATGNVPSPVAANAVVKFAGKPELLVQEVTPAPLTFSAAGQAIRFKYTIKNAGSVDVPTFSINDSKGALVTCLPSNGPVGGLVKAGNFDFNCSGSYTTTTADVGKDIASNVTVSALMPSGKQPPSAAKPVTVKFAGKPSFALEHKCNPQKYTAAGQVITCEFVVRNTGNVPIKSCKITGSRLNAVCPAGLIPPGGSIAVKGTYTSTLADVGKTIVLDYLLEGQTQ